MGPVVYMIRRLLKHYVSRLYFMGQCCLVHLLKANLNGLKKKMFVWLKEQLSGHIHATMEAFGAHGPVLMLGTLGHYLTCQESEALHQLLCPSFN